MKTFQFAAVALATLFTGSTFAAESQQKSPMVSVNIQVKTCVLLPEPIFTTSKVVASGQIAISPDSIAKEVKKNNGLFSTLLTTSDGINYDFRLQYDLSQPNALPTAILSANDGRGYILDALSAKASTGEVTSNTCLGYSQVLWNNHSVTLNFSKLPLLSQLNLK